MAWGENPSQKQKKPPQKKPPLHIDEKPKRLNLDKIRIPENWPQLSTSNVEGIVESLRLNGQHNPIFVRQSGDGINDEVLLVNGAHRLEAAKRLDWKTIEVRFVTGGEKQAKKITISEDLHRKDNTALRLAELIVEWEELKQEDAQVAHPLGGRQPNDRGVSRTSKALNKSRRDITRARKIAAIAPAAKQAIREFGLEDNQRALLAISDAATEEDQVAKVRELSQRKSSKKSNGPKQVRKPRASFDNKALDTRDWDDDDELGDEDEYDLLKEAWEDSDGFREAWNAAPDASRRKFVLNVLKLR